MKSGTDQKVERVATSSGQDARRANQLRRWLMGTWQSDRRRSLRNYKSGGKPTPARHRKFRAIFGKLKVRWTRQRYYTEFMGSKKRGKYEIVASDSNSVIVRTLVADGEDGLQQIHFDGPDTYWVGCAGILCEYFQRIK
jgi:hypothetical protein